MKSSANDLLDPSVCSCFSGSHPSIICNKVKWSTLSIAAALLIIVAYLSSGLYSLIDVTTILSTQSSHNDPSETLLWSIASSSWVTILGWMSVFIYFAVVLVITILLCGIQLSKPWLLFVWSILMIFMVLIDGIITILSLRQHQQQKSRPTKQVQILFLVMIVRLIVSLCGIFVALFHFRRLKTAQSEHINRQRMLDRYNSESPSPSYHESWARPTALSNPTKMENEDAYVGDPPPHLSLPRAKMSNAASHPASNMFQTYNHSSEYVDHSQRRAFNRQLEDFRYNVPLQERFHQHQIKTGQKF